jgi:coenzyme F420-reducing hydrogenase delta subunit
MVAGCNPGDCHYNTGNLKARRRLMLLNKMLTQFGIEPERLKMKWIETSEAPKFQSILNEFIEEVTKLGPLTTKVATAEKA